MDFYISSFKCYDALVSSPSLLTHTVLVLWLPANYSLLVDRIIFIYKLIGIQNLCCWSLDLTGCKIFNGYLCSDDICSWFCAWRSPSWKYTGFSRRSYWFLNWYGCDLCLHFRLSSMYRFYHLARTFEEKKCSALRSWDIQRIGWEV